MAKLASKLSKIVASKYERGENTLLREVKTNPKDRIKVEIGDSKQPDFKPQFKFMRWDNEVNFSLRAEEDPTAVIQTEGELVKYIAKDYEVHLYDRPELSEDGGFEFEWVLPKKPASNILRGTIQTKDLDFFYQPALTPEEIAEGVERPENIVGSYAVCHKTKVGMNMAEGMEYKVGKAFHIYRPKVTDKNGNQTWGDLNINQQTGELTVTVNQTWLNNAVYPVVVDPTFGYTSIGASTLAFGTSGIIALVTLVNTYVASAGDTLTEYSVYGNSGSSTTQNQMAAYEYSGGVPGNRLGSVSLINQTTTPGWRNASVSLALTASTEYCIGWSCTNPSPNNGAIYYDSGSPPGRKSHSTSTDLLDPFGTVGADSGRHYSIYATYTTSVSINKNESITVTESKSAALIVNINKSESITVSESVTVFTDILYLSASENITVSENKLLDLAISINKSESITVSESVSVFTDILHLSVSDSITVSESVNRDLEIKVGVSESITVSENKSVELGPQPQEISKLESITVSEAIEPSGMLLSININKSESISITESYNVSTGDLGALTINRYEAINITDIPHYYNDQILVLESVSLFTLASQIISVSDNITVTDIAHYYDDIVAIADRPSVVVGPSPALVSVSDNITVSEASTLFVLNQPGGAVAQDNVTVTDFPKFYRDTITVTESVHILVGTLGVGAGDPVVSDLVSVSESVRVRRPISVPYRKNAPFYLDIGGRLSIMLGRQRTSTWDSNTRPVNPQLGTFGYNLDLQQWEEWDGEYWRFCETEFEEGGAVVAGDKNIFVTEVVTVIDLPLRGLEIQVSDTVSVNESRSIEKTEAGTGLFLSVSEEITITDLPRYYDDTVHAVDRASIVVGGAPTSERFVNKSEVIEVNEAKNLLISQLFINKSESITVSESINQGANTRFIDVSDSVNVWEYPVSPTQLSGQTSKVMRFFYVYASDQTINTTNVANLETMARRIQQWYSNHTNNDSTYAVRNEDVVETIQLPNTVSHYAGKPGHSYIVNQLFAMLPDDSGYQDLNYHWVFVLDFGGWNNGANFWSVVISGVDIYQGLASANPNPVTGAMAHEIGHTFGLNHMDQPTDNPTEIWSLMSSGWSSWPNTWISSRQRTRLTVEEEPSVPGRAVDFVKYNWNVKVRLNPPKIHEMEFLYYISESVSLQVKPILLSKSETITVSENVKVRNSHWRYIEAEEPIYVLETPSQTPLNGSNDYQVRFAYFLPSDGVEETNFTTALRSIIPKIQEFYARNTDNERTFTTRSQGVLEIYYSSQPYSYYTGSNYESKVRSTFATALAAAGQTTSNTKWNIFCNAHSEDGTYGVAQTTGFGSAAYSTAVYARLVLEDLVNPNKIPHYYHVPTHELGHTFGLVHFPTDGSVMTIPGSFQYPTATFRQTDKNILRTDSEVAPFLTKSWNIRVKLNEPAIKKSESVTVSESVSITKT